MYKFSQKSLDKLETCHPDLQKVFKEVIKYVDCTIIEGVRSVETQEEYVRTGKSRTMESKHLKQNDGYSHAIDVAMYPIDWNDRDNFVYFAGFVIGVASQMGIKIIWGGDWNSNFRTKDTNFFDGPHFQLKE